MTRKNHSAHWDFVRGASMAVMLVMHTSDLAGWYPFRYQLMSFCYPLIEPIIFLSGYLICLRTSREVLAPGFNAMTSAKGYAFRRVIRTWPMYFLFIGVCFLIPSLPEFPVTKPFWAFATFTMNYDLKPGGLAHLWTLSLEEWCYFLFAFTIPWLASPRIRWVFIVLALIPLGLRVYMLSESGPLRYFEYFTEIHYFTLTHWDSFWWGCLLGSFGRLNLSEKIQRRCLFSGVLLMIAAIIVGFYFRRNPTVWLQTIYPVWGALCSALIVCGLPLVPAHWLVRTGLVHLGIISYTLYLTHKVILMNFFRLNRFYGLLPSHSWPEVLTGYIFVFAVGALLFYVFERPILKYLRRPSSPTVSATG